MQLTRVDLQIANTGLSANIVVPGGQLDHQAAAELAVAAESLIEQRDLRVVTVSNSGDDFCTGPAEDLRVYDLRPDPAAALARLRVPVIAAIGGACVGEGLEIVLAADIRIGNPGSRFALDHVLGNRVPAWGGTQRLPRCIRPGAAASMALLGEAVDSTQAKQLGLLYEVSEDLPKRSAELVEVLISRGPLALEFTKEAVHRGSELPLRDGLRLEGDLNHQLAATEDRAEGLQAFFDKRPPDFGGR